MVSKAGLLALGQAPNLLIQVLSSSVQTATKANDTYAMKVAVADGAGENGACEYKDLGSSDTSVDARVYLRLSALPKNGSIVEIFGFSSGGWLPKAVGTRIDIVNVNGTVEWRLNYNNNGWQSAYSGSITAGAWYSVEVKLVLGSGTGETHLYVNGVELVSKTGLSNVASGNSVRYFSLGVDDEVGGNTLNVFFDSVVVSDAYIGPDPTSTPIPTASPSPSPSANSNCFAFTVTYRNPNSNIIPFTNANSVAHTHSLHHLQLQP